MTHAAKIKTVYPRKTARPHLREPGSALTHAAALVAALIATLPLLLHAQKVGAGPVTMGSLLVFMVSMMLLYAASTIYHALGQPPKGNPVLRRLDH
ncbi:MAG: hemolysin III family protein, partial [Gemmiger sp.]|nr:hemolysin III family protein [Gemmiger sp.]